MILKDKKIMVSRTLSIFSSLSLIWTTAHLNCLGQNDNSIIVRASSTGSAKTTASKSTMLYGRIEQITGGSGAQFPVLKEQTAMLDSRQLPSAIRKGKANANNYSGSVVRSFPQQFSGTWGGHLKIWTSQMDAVCWQLDSEEATRTRQFLTPGREGSVNFYFQQSGSGKIDLEPAQIVFMVPMIKQYVGCRRLGTSWRANFTWYGLPSNG
jgi:hypothetical protein